MMRRLILLLSVFISIQTLSQEREIDSIRSFLNQHTQKDTLRLEALNDLIYLYYSFDPEEGIHLSTEAIALAESLKEPKRLATIYNNLGHNYTAKGQDSTALVMYEKAIDIHLKMGNKDGASRAIFNKGIVYFNRSDYRSSLDYYKRALMYFEKEKDSSVMANILNSIGVSYMYIGDYTEAMKTYFRVLNIHENIKPFNELHYGNSLNNIGLLYKNMKKLPLAITYYERALDIFKKIDVKVAMANTMSNLGTIYDNLEDSEKAIDLYEEASKLYTTIGDERGVARTFANLGIAHTALSHYIEALEYFKKANLMFTKSEDFNNAAIVENSIGLVYMNMADQGLIQKQKGYREAEKHFVLSKQTSEKFPRLQNQIETLTNLSQLYYKQGNYKRAFESKVQADIYKDSILTQDKKEEIVRLEEQYAYDKKALALKAANDKEQALSKAEIRRQKDIKNGSIIGGSALMGMLLIGLFSYKRKQDAVSQKKEAEFKATMAETELKALRAQINPHFIFNSLNSINDYISKNDSIAAKDYLTKFAKIMRQTLENSNQKEITLEDDLKLLELYLQIESIRLQHGFTYQIIVDDTLDRENILMPPFILQPFVENSIWHGLSKKKGKGHIWIEIKKLGGMLLCSVDDDGIGRKTLSISNERRSYGVDITKSRIEILNKLKSSNGKLDIIDKSEGVRVEILLPLQFSF